MIPENRTLLIDRLARARGDGHLAEALSPELVPDDADEAYAVAAEVERRLGWDVAGWKIAATAEETQRRLRSPEPIKGPVYRRFVHASPVTLAFAPLLVPLIECEIAFRLARDLPADGSHDETSVCEAIGAALPAIEVAECRFRNADLPPVEGVLADGSGNGHLVLGEPVENWRSLDLADLAVTLETDGRKRREGRGGDVMGDPVRAVAWLAGRLAREGRMLRAGDVVSTGTLTGMVPPRAGETHVGHFGPLGRVEVSFE